MEDEDRDLNIESLMEVPIDSVLGSVLAASAVFRAWRRSTQAVKGDAEDDNIEEMVGRTVQDKAWVCPCGCRPADAITLEIPEGRARCACRMCQWTA